MHGETMKMSINIILPKNINLPNKLKISYFEIKIFLTFFISGMHATRFVYPVIHEKLTIKLLLLHLALVSQWEMLAAKFLWVHIETDARETSEVLIL